MFSRILDVSRVQSIKWCPASTGVSSTVVTASIVKYVRNIFYEVQERGLERVGVACGAHKTSHGVNGVVFLAVMHLRCVWVQYGRPAIITNGRVELATQDACHVESRAHIYSSSSNTLLTKRHGETENTSNKPRKVRSVSKPVRTYAGAKEFCIHARGDDYIHYS